MRVPGPERPFYHHLSRFRLRESAALLPDGVAAEVRPLLLARGLRAFGDGFVAVLLPAYLSSLGFDAVAVGGLTTATLLGSSLLTLAVGGIARHWSRRLLLMAAGGLMAATGFGFAGVDGWWPLLVIAFVGTVNPGGGDVSPFVPLEQAALAQATSDRARTALFARYSLVGALIAALGALAAAAPVAIAAATGWTTAAAIRPMFLLYGLLGLAAVLCYRRLPRRDADHEPRRAPLGPSRGRVYRLAMLFSLDAFAGGFIVQSLLALWLFERFGLSLTAAASFFFWSGVLTALSYLVAVPVARRFGLIRTMVFTHLPSSLLLILVPFTSSLEWALALLLARSALSQMDVPTRGSYVMAVVTPAERPAAAALTAVPRGLAAAASPLLAGALLAVSAQGWPLVVAGTLKILYDLLLLRGFHAVKPPEETE